MAATARAILEIQTKVDTQEIQRAIQEVETRLQSLRKTAADPRPTHVGRARIARETLASTVEPLGAVRGALEGRGLSAEAARLKAQFLATTGSLDALARQGLGSAQELEGLKGAAEQAARLARAKTNQETKLAQTQTQTEEIGAEQAALASLKAQEVAVTQQLLQADKAYKDATARATVARERIAAEVDSLALSELGRDSEFMRNQGIALAERQRIDTRSQLISEQRLQEDPFQTQAAGELEAMRRQRMVREQHAAELVLRADTELAQVTGNLNALRRQREIRERQATISTGQVMNLPEQEGALAAQEQLNRSMIERARIEERNVDVMGRQAEITNTGLVQAQNHVDNVERQVVASRKLADNENLAANQAEVSARQQELKLQTDLQTQQQLQKRGFYETQATYQAQQESIRLTQKNALLNARLRNDHNLSMLQGEEIILQRQLNVQQRQIAHERMKQLQAQGVITRGTLTQQFQANIANMRGGPVRMDQEFPGFKQLMGRSFMTTARFATSGLLLYGGIQFIRGMVNDAQELQQELKLIQSQFDGMGDSIDGMSFEKLRGDILDTARETGTMASEIALVTRQLAGAFAVEGTGGQMMPNYALAESQGRTAFRLAKITNLELQEVNNELTAIALSFADEDGPLSFDKIADNVVGLEKEFGVLAAGLIKFTADIAPVGTQLGFTAEQLTAVGAVMGQAMGRSPATLAEQFGRIMGSLQGEGPQIIDIFAGAGAAVNDLALHLTRRDIPEALKEMLSLYDQLGSDARSNLIKLIGGERQFATTSALFDRPEVMLRALDIAPDEHEGEFAKRWSRYASTVAHAMDRMKRAFEEFGIELFEAGLKDVLTLFAGVGELVATGLGVLSKAMNAFTIAGTNIPLLLLSIAALMKAATVASNLWAGSLGKLTKALFAQSTAAKASAAATSSAVAAQSAGGLILPAGMAPPPVVPVGHRAQILPAPGRGLGRIPGIGSGQTPLGAGRLGATLAFGVKALPIAAGLFAFQQVSSEAQRTGEKVDRAQEDAMAKITLAVQEHNLTIVEFEEILREQEKGVNVLSKGLGRLGVRSILGVPTGGAEAIRRMREESTDLFQERLTVLVETLAEDMAELEVQVRYELVEALEGVTGDRPSTTGLWQGLGGDTTVEATIDPEKLIEDVLSGEHNALVAFEELLSDISVLDPEFAGKMSQALRDYAKAQKNVALAEGEEDRLKEIDSLRRQAEAGIISPLQLQNALRAAVRVWEGIVATGLAQGDNMDWALEILAGHQITLRDSIAPMIRDAFSLSASFADILGQSTPEVRADRAIAQIDRMRAAGVDDPAEVRQAVIDLLQAEKDAAQAAVDAIEDNAKRAAAAARGWVPSDRARQEMLSQFLATEQARVMLERFNEAVGGSIKDTNAMVVDIINEHGKDSINIILEMIRGRRAAQAAAERAARAVNVFMSRRQRRWTVPGSQGGISGLLGVVDTARGMLTDIASDAQIIADFNNFLGDHLGALDAGGVLDAGGADSGTDDLARRIAEARIAVERARADGDPTRLADLAVQSAHIQIQFASDEAEKLEGFAALIEAQNQVRDAQVSRTAALRDLALAQEGDDPVAAAGHAALNAQDAVNRAKTGEQKMIAEAAKIRADRTLADAIRDIGTAQLELLQAVEEAAGRATEAAAIGVKLAQRELARIREDSPGDTAAILRGEAAETLAKARERDAQFQERMGDIDFLREMERISVQQAIQMLESMLGLPIWTGEQMRNIERRIKQLRDEINRDLQWNIPDIRLPTLYEVRRLMQTGGAAGQTYQDMRQVSIDVHISSDADSDAFMQQLAEVVGAPPVTGTAPRLY